VSVVDRVLLAAGGGALLLAILAGWLLLAPAGGADDPSAIGLAEPSPLMPIVASPSATAVAAEVVVDVEGGVMEPGLQRLPPGARIADAIAAAGGYAPSADLDAATRGLNLAAPLSDGEQVYVPMVGDDAPTAAESQPPASGGTGGSGSGAAGGGGLIDLNTASPEELDTLPGIGPVTVQKIVAARQEQPFASLEEAVERDVLNRGQLEKIRDLATAG
jgi:competence protein ComEA